MNVLFITSECYPFIKVGGLGDVAGSLPKAMQNLGVNMMIALPYYGSVSFPTKDRAKLIKEIKFSFRGKNEIVKIYETKYPGTEIPVFLLKNKNYISENEVYPRPYEKQVNQFIFFSRALLKFLKDFKTKIDLLHVNDWPTAIIPGLLKTEYRVHPFLKEVATLLTIHNLGPQGVVETNVLEDLAMSEYSLPSIAWDAENEDIDLLMQGIMNSDLINTVSDSYAKEIMTEEYGEGLNRVLKSREERFFGVLNGIDYHVFNPETDNRIKFQYNINNWKEGKFQNKIFLQKKLNFEVDGGIPFIGVVTRLTEQKGLELIISSMKYLIEKGFQVLILGTGRKKYEIELKKLSVEFSKRFKAILKYDADLSSQIFAGVDIFLVPSKFEPCGLTQMIAMKYGTLPVVRAVGGLKDTVKHGKNGFVFSDFNVKSLKKVLIEAKSVLQKNIKSWQKMVENAMDEDFSWNNSAKKYFELYKKAIKFKREESD